MEGGHLNLQYREYLKAVINQPDFFDRYMSFRTAHEIIVHCEELELWDEIVKIEEAVGVLKGDLKMGVRGDTSDATPQWMWSFPRPGSFKRG